MKALSKSSQNPSYNSDVWEESDEKSLNLSSQQVKEESTEFILTLQAKDIGLNFLTLSSLNLSDLVWDLQSVHMCNYIL